MKVAIKDANVLIDLEAVGLLDLWFQLDYETHTTVLIVGQLEAGRHDGVRSYIEAGFIKVESCPPAYLEECMELMSEIGSGPDIADCSVLLLAMKKKAMLLSGDAPLRRAAKVKQVDVHGTIWIFDRLIEEKLLPSKVAAQKMRALLDSCRYLPTDTCEKRIAQWDKG